MIKGLTFLLALGGAGASYIRGPLEAGDAEVAAGTPAAPESTREAASEATTGPAPSLAEKKARIAEQQQQLENEYASKKAMLKAEKNDVVAKIHEEKRARLDEEIEETQAKAEEDKLKAEEAAKKSGTGASGSKPSIDEEVAAPTDNVKKAAAEAKEAAAAACDDAREKEKGQGGAEAESEAASAEAAVQAEELRKKAIIEAQEKGVASVEAAKKSAEDTHTQMLAHEKNLEAAEQVEAGCPDEKNSMKGDSGSATGSETPGDARGTSAAVEEASQG
eukprot:g47.t1